MSRLAELTATVKREVQFLRRLASHAGTPRASKWLLAAALGYLALPFDLVPDWIPVVGQLDDVLVVLTLVYLAMRLIPDGVIRDCRQESSEIVCSSGDSERIAHDAGSVEATGDEESAGADPPRCVP
jgi:uncharacterized membrane protein YkvA (DUF1232 family)